MNSESRRIHGLDAGPINGVIILLFGMTCNDIEGMTRKETNSKKRTHEFDQRTWSLVPFGMGGKVIFGYQVKHLDEVMKFPLVRAWKTDVLGTFDTNAHQLYLLLF
jgi:hypothetical protein